MQPLLLLDYLDGSKKPVDEIWEEIVTFFKHADKLDKGDDYRTARLATERIQEKEDLPIVMKWLGCIKVESALNNLYVAYSSFIKNKGNIYVYSKGLIEALSETSLDVKIDYLPEKFSGFLELPSLKDRDGDLIKGIFIDIGSLKGERYLRYAYATNIRGLTIGYSLIDLRKGEMLSKAVQRYKYIETNIKKNIKSVTSDAKLHQSMVTIINAILYLNSANTDMFETTNEFSHKLKRATTQKNIFTSKNYWRVGDNIEKDVIRIRKQLRSNIDVRGHWRWQPYGVQRKDLKFIFINPHIRNKKD